MFSGIESASVAWHPLGWSPVAFAEIDPFASAVLAHRFPTVPNLGDVEKADFDAIGPIDLLVGGSPCQSFSNAGRRLGLDDPRGHLALVYGAVLYRKLPRWFVFENVPRLLTLDEGDAFGTLLATFAGWPKEHVFRRPADGWRSAGVVAPAHSRAYGLAWRVLDAQHVRVESHPRAVPQRRERVFIVGHLGDWRPSAAALLEPEGVQGHPPPRRAQGKAAAPTLSARPSAGGGLGTDFDLDGGLIPLNDLNGASHALNGKATAAGYMDAQAETYIGAFNIYPAHGQGADLEASPTDVANAVTAVQAGKVTERGTRVIAFDTTQITSKDNRCQPQPGGPCHPLAAKAHPPAIADSARASVRRLSPLECERLQGFPDGWTDIPYRSKEAADSPRYKALGNSKAVNVMRFIGERIALCDSVLATLQREAAE